VREAPAILARLTTLYLSGLESPWPFLPRSSWVYLRRNSRGGDRTDPSDFTGSQEFSGGTGWPGESEDKAFRILFPRPPAAEELVRCGRAFFEPCLAHLEPETP